MVAVAAVALGAAWWSAQTGDDGAPPPPPTRSAESLVTTTSLSPIAFDEREVLDTTWISSDVGWVLIGEPCGTGAVPHAEACAVLYATRDGGSTFEQLRAFDAEPNRGDPGDGLRDGCERHPCVGGVLFDDADHGYAYGPDLMSTDDGGATWRTERSDPVLAMRRSDRWTVRLTSPCAELSSGPRACRQSAEASERGSGRWTPLPPPGTEGSSASLVLGPDGTATLRASGAGSDHGIQLVEQLVLPEGSWVPVDAPCDWMDLAAPATRPVDTRFLCLNALGARPSAGTSTSVWRLRPGVGPTDEHEVAVVGEGPMQGGTALAVLDDDVLLVIQDRTVQRSADGGRTWRSVFRFLEDEYVDPGGSLIAIDDRTAVLHALDRIWRTTDAGRTWSPLRGPARVVDDPQDLVGAAPPRGVPGWETQGGSVLDETHSVSAWSKRGELFFLLERRTGLRPDGTSINIVLAVVSTGPMDSADAYSTFPPDCRDAAHVNLDDVVAVAEGTDPAFNPATAAWRIDLDAETFVPEDTAGVTCWTGNPD